jgi:hypothetical protein
MILKSAIDAYLNAPRDNHDWMKDLTDRELDDAIAALRPRPWMPASFDKHQKVGFLLGVAYPQFCYWYDMGTGKTLLLLTLLKYLFDLQRINKALVVPLNDEATDGWLQQVGEWKVDLPVLPLFKGATKDKWPQVLEFDRGLIMPSYPGLRAMVSGKVERKKGDGAELKKVPEKMAQMLKGVGAAIWDESTEMAGTKSLNHSIARTIAKVVPYRYALAGQPFGRDPVMLWAQHFIVDGGASLGPTKGLFQEALYTKSKSYWGGPYSFKYKFRSEMKDQLNLMIKHRSISYDEAECGTLPELISQVVKVKFPESAGAYYKAQLKRLQYARGDYREMQNAFIKLRQISSGFLGVKDDETGDKIELEFDANPKRARLLDLVLQVPKHRKALIFYEFTHSGRRITHELKSLGFNPIWLWSGTEDSRSDIAAFKADSMDVDCAVINWRVGAFSLNLQRANYAFVYESPVPVIARRQMIKRIHRKGQPWSCHIYDLVTEGTVDERILKFHAEGMSLFEAVMRDPAIAA